MFFPMIYRHSGLCRLHSPDLADMRRAILDEEDGPEDDDGPDGGSPHVAFLDRTGRVPAAGSLRG